jgi:hypothetical protein
MNCKQPLLLAIGLALGVSMANAGITYTCSPSVAASTCNYLNTTVAGLYSSTFTDANADIYITYGTTSLGQSQTAFNVVTYSQYVAALAANPDKDAVQTSANASLAANAAAPYGAGNVSITGPLATALGLTADVQGGLAGVTSTGAVCSLPSVGCYDAAVTITNDPGTPLYYDNLGGPEPSNAYDFYATVEHETDEVLGTSSCIDTTTTPLSDGCDPFGAGTPSAVDLFRYSAPGSLILDSSLSTTPGAYFSYNGGVTNPIVGVGGAPKFYDTLDNGDDYGDFVSSSPDCGTNQIVQDGEGCPGEDKGLSILNDGKGEITILNAVGFDMKSASVVPEPSFMGAIGLGLVFLGVLKYKLRSRA